MLFNEDDRVSDGDDVDDDDDDKLQEWKIMEKLEIGNGLSWWQSYQVHDIEGIVIMIMMTMTLVLMIFFSLFFLAGGVCDLIQNKIIHFFVDFWFSVAGVWLVRFPNCKWVGEPD